MKNFGKICVLFLVAFLLMGSSLDQTHVNVTKVDVGEKIAPGIATMFKFSMENKERSDVSITSVRVSIIADVTDNYRRLSNCTLLANNKRVSTANPRPVRGAGELFFMIKGGSLVKKNSRQAFAVNCKVSAPLKAGTIITGFVNGKQTDPFFAIDMVKAGTKEAVHATTARRDLIQVKTIK